MNFATKADLRWSDVRPANVWSILIAALTATAVGVAAGLAHPFQQLVGVLSVLSVLVLLSVLLPPFRDPFQPIYWATGMFFMHFCMRSWLNLLDGSRYLGSPPFDPTTVHAWTVALLFLIPCFIVFVGAYYVGPGAQIAGRLPRLPYRWTGRRTVFAIVSLTLIGLAAFALLVLHVGPYNYVTDKIGARTTPGTDVYELPKQGITLALLLLYGFVRATGRSRLWMAPSLAVTLVVSSLSGSRGTFLFWVLSLVVMHYYTTRALGRKLLLILGVFLLALPAYDIFGHATGADDLIARINGFDPRELSAWATFSAVTSRAYGIDSLVIFVQETPDREPFQLGSTIAPVLYGWIPRLIWEDKPVVSAGLFYADRYFSHFYAGTSTSVAATILGDAYVNFHVPGMIVASALAGVSLRALYEYSLKGNGVTGVFLYATMFASLFMFWENAIYGAIMSYVPVLLFAVGVAWFVGQPPPEQRAPTADRA